jgi:hypothetical protein
MRRQRAWRRSAKKSCGFVEMRLLGHSCSRPPEPDQRKQTYRDGQHRAGLRQELQLRLVGGQHEAVDHCVVD